MDYRDSILEYIRKVKIFSIADIQSELSLGYKAVRDFVIELEKECDVQLSDGVRFKWTGCGEHESEYNTTETDEEDEDNEDDPDSSNGETKVDDPLSFLFGDPNLSTKQINKRKNLATDISRLCQIGYFDDYVDPDDGMTPISRKQFDSNEEAVEFIEQTLSKNFIYDRKSKIIRQRMQPHFPNGMPLEIKYVVSEGYHILTDNDGMYNYLTAITSHINLPEVELWKESLMMELEADSYLQIDGNELYNNLVILNKEKHIVEEVESMAKIFEDFIRKIDEAYNEIPDSPPECSMSYAEREDVADSLKEIAKCVDYAHVDKGVLKIVKYISDNHSVTLEDARHICLSACSWAEITEDISVEVFRPAYNMLSQLTPFEFNVLKKCGKK